MSAQRNRGSEVGQTPETYKSGVRLSMTPSIYIYWKLHKADQLFNFFYTLHILHDF